MKSLVSFINESVVVNEKHQTMPRTEAFFKKEFKTIQAALYKIDGDTFDPALCMVISPAYMETPDFDSLLYDVEDYFSESGTNESPEQLLANYFYAVYSEMDDKKGKIIGKWIDAMRKDGYEPDPNF